MKSNQQHQQQQENQFKQDLSFQEWLDYFQKEPTNKELDDMERKSQDKRRFYHPLNNPYYEPLQGA
jgi:hypothetical protein